MPLGAEVAKICDFTQGEDLIDLSAVSTFVTAANPFDVLQTVGGVPARLLINGDRGIILRDITEAELTQGDLIF